VAFELYERLAAAKPDALVTFHSWSRSGSATPYVEHDIADQPSRELALALGLPFVEAWDWPIGALGRETTALGIATAELELYGLGRHTDEGLAYGIRAARAAASWLGMIDPVRAPLGVEVDRRVVTAKVAGRVVHTAALGSEVEAGRPVAELRGSDGSTRATLYAPDAGWVGIQVTYGQVAAGDPVLIIFVKR
jgi:predicted deacylase